MWDHKRETAMLCARAGGDHVCACESGCEIVDRQGGMPVYACVYINVGGRHVCQRAGFVCVRVRKWVRDRGQTRERDQNVPTNP